MASMLSEALADSDGNQFLNADVIVLRQVFKELKDLAELFVIPICI